MQGTETPVLHTHITMADPGRGGGERRKGKRSDFQHFEHFERSLATGEGCCLVGADVTNSLRSEAYGAVLVWTAAKKLISAAPAGGIATP